MRKALRAGAGATGRSRGAAPPAGKALAAVLLALSFATGGSPPRAEEREASPAAASRLGANARFVLSRPFHADRRGKLRIASVVAGTVVLYGLRHEIRDAFRDRPSEGRSRVLDAARTMGKGAFAPSLALVLWSTSWGDGDPRGREAAALVLQSAAISALLAEAGSFVLAAERPRDGDSVRALSADGHGVSLDAALAASVVVPMRRLYLRTDPEDSKAKRVGKRAASALLYAGAVATGLQRIDADAHWAPDAFLGLATGFAVGGALCDATGVPRTRRADWSVSPSREGVVVRIAWPAEPPPGRARTPRG